MHGDNWNFQKNTKCFNNIYLPVLIALLYPTIKYSTRRMLINICIFLCINNRIVFKGPINVDKILNALKIFFYLQKTEIRLYEYSSIKNLKKTFFYWWLMKFKNLHTKWWKEFEKHCCSLSTIAREGRYKTIIRRIWENLNEEAWNKIM